MARCNLGQTLGCSRYLRFVELVLSLSCGCAVLLVVTDGSSMLVRVGDANAAIGVLYISVVVNKTLEFLAAYQYNTH